MKKFLVIGCLLQSSLAMASNYTVDTCYSIEKNLQIFDYKVIAGCQRIPEGVLVTVNKFQNSDDKDVAFASAAIAFGQNNHSLAYQRYKMIITPLNSESKWEINWIDAKTLNSLSKSNKNIDELLNKSALSFKDITPVAKSQNTLQETPIEKPSSYSSNIIRGLPPPPPKLK